MSQASRDSWRQYFNQPSLYPADLGFYQADWRQADEPPEGPTEGLLYALAAGPVAEPEVALFVPTAVLKRAGLVTPAVLAEFWSTWRPLWQDLAERTGLSLDQQWPLVVSAARAATVHRDLSAHRMWGWLTTQAGKIRLSLSRQMVRRLRASLNGRPQLTPNDAWYPISRPFEDGLCRLFVPPLVEQTDYTFSCLPAALKPTAETRRAAVVWTVTNEPALVYRLTLPSGREPGAGLRNIVQDALQTHFQDVPAELWQPGALRLADLSAVENLTGAWWLEYEGQASTIPFQLDVGLHPGRWAEHFQLRVGNESVARQLAGLRDHLRSRWPEFRPQGPPSLGAFLAGLDGAAFEDTVHELIDQVAGRGRRAVGRYFYWRETYESGSGRRVKIRRDPWFPEARFRRCLPSRLQGSWQPEPAPDRAAFDAAQVEGWSALEAELVADRWRPGPNAQADLNRLWIEPRQTVIRRRIAQLNQSNLVQTLVTLPALEAERVCFRLSDQALALVLLESEDQRWRKFVSFNRELRLKAERTYWRFRRDQQTLAPETQLAALEAAVAELAVFLDPDRMAAFRTPE